MPTKPLALFGHVGKSPVTFSFRLSRYRDGTYGRVALNITSGFQVDEQAPRYYEAHVRHFMQPFVEALIAQAVRNGDAVLDVACGTGFATRAASEKVGSKGRVVGTDLNPHMLATARSVAHNGNITWHPASALDLPFADEEFDVVICQQGVQFFPDPGAGLREMARVSKRGIAITAWSALKDSPYLATAWDMLTRRCGTSPAQYATGFSERDDISGWFRAANLQPVSINLVEAVVSLPPVAEYLPDHFMTVPFAGDYFQLGAAARADAVRDVDERLRDFRTADGLDVPFSAYIASTIS